jgi:DNA polymerase-3 subunit delta
LDQERLIRWVAREFKGYHLQADRQTIEHLIFACGKELMALKSEIAKISSYAEGKNSVSQQDIDAIATLSVEYKVFDLSDKVADGKAAQALPLMNEMLRSGEQRLMLLALLQRHYRQLLFTRIMMDDRASESAIAAELGLPGFVARRLTQSAQAYSTSQLQTAYAKCINQEFLVKSGQLAEDGSLEQLVLSLISIKNEGRTNPRA